MITLKEFCPTAYAAFEDLRHFLLDYFDFGEEAWWSIFGKEKDTCSGADFVASLKKMHFPYDAKAVFDFLDFQHKGSISMYRGRSCRFHRRPELKSRRLELLNCNL